MTAFPDHPFWDWSLAVYGRPGVEDVLLDLQDRLGLDVNLLLFACWTGATGRGALPPGEWTVLVDGATDWRVNVVQPLRAVRRHLKGQAGQPGAAALRDRVKALELDAEHAAQLAIAGLVRDRSAADVPAARRLADARANLLAYASAAGLALTEGDCARLDSILRGLCGDPQP